MRKLLNALYTGSIWLAALFMIGVLAMVLLHNVFCATQDVAIDSLAVSTLRRRKKGRKRLTVKLPSKYAGV